LGAGLLFPTLAVCEANGVTYGSPGFCETSAEIIIEPPGSDCLASGCTYAT
jgi:hypothetical protein